MKDGRLLLVRPHVLQAAPDDIGSEVGDGDAAMGGVGLWVFLAESSLAVLVDQGAADLDDHARSSSR